MFTEDMTTWLPETSDWVPAECDVPIRNQKWFWHAGEEHCIRPLDELIRIYYHSVGHGANLLINLAPDQTGRIPRCDADRLLEMTGEIHRRFASPLFEGSGRGQQIVWDLHGEITLNHIVLMEDISNAKTVVSVRISTRPLIRTNAHPRLSGGKTVFTVPSRSSVITPDTGD